MDDLFVVTDVTVKIAEWLDRRYDIPVHLTAESIREEFKKDPHAPYFPCPLLEDIVEYRLRRLFTEPEIITTIDCPS